MMSEIILNEIYNYCEECPFHECCPEYECVLFRIENIIKNYEKGGIDNGINA